MYNVGKILEGGRGSSCFCMSVSPGNTILCTVIHTLLFLFFSPLETPAPPHLTFSPPRLSNIFCLSLLPFNKLMKGFYRTPMCVGSFMCQSDICPGPRLTCTNKPNHRASTQCATCLRSHANTRPNILCQIHICTHKAPKAGSFDTDTPLHTHTYCTWGS